MAKKQIGPTAPLSEIRSRFNDSLQAYIMAAGELAGIAQMILDFTERKPDGSAPAVVMPKMVLDHLRDKLEAFEKSR